MKRLSRLTSQQAKHQIMKLIIEGFDGCLLISQAAEKVFKLLRTIQPNGRPAGKQRNDLGHEWSDPRMG